MKKKVVVLMGGYGPENEISIKSGMVICKHLDKSRFEVFQAIITQEAWYVDHDGDRLEIDRSDFSIAWIDGRLTFDVAFNIIHGTPGEDGLLQGYLEMIGLPYTGSGAYESALTFNKRDTISVLSRKQISAATNITLDLDEEYDVDEIINTVGLPCFVKANRSGSSYGVYKSSSKSDLTRDIKEAFKYDDQLIIESFLDGVEVSVGVIPWKGGFRALSPTEIVSENDFFDFDAKYMGKSQEITPARISESDTIKVKSLTMQIFKLLNLSGFARADFIFHNGEPHFIEVNTNPGMSEASIVPQQVRHEGISLTEMLTEVVMSCA